MLKPGKTVCKRYKIVRILGSGGMGSVAEAEDTVLNRKCAIKEIGDLALQAAGGSDNFKREAITLQDLKHDKIVGYRGFEQESGGRTLYIITELVEGTSLEGKIFPESAAIDIVLQILEGLGYAHSKGVVHRDIKPANVMLTHGRDVVIVDFGIAKSGGVAGGTMFQAKGAYTPYYASPEQASMRTTGLATDIYSAGVLLYEILTGRAKMVFPDDPSTRYQRDMVSSLPAVSPAMHSILMKATSVFDRSRYQSAEEFAIDLRAMRGGSVFVPPTPPTPNQSGQQTAITPTKDKTSIFDIRRK